MISITRLLGGSGYYGDQLRYCREAGQVTGGATYGRGPVVVWNMTQNCNLTCRHCYASSRPGDYTGEMSREEGLKFLEELADFRVPVVLFSGGEPLLREDFFDLADQAARLGLRATLSTNGTLVTPGVARDIKKRGISYVGISLDGLEELNDRFRGKPGAFSEALAGIRACRQVDQKVGLRFTINRHNYHQVEDIFYLIQEEGIPRVCFYHLVYSGRGENMQEEDISPGETRALLDLIIDKTREFMDRGDQKEVLTVDNHADGVYLYLREKAREPEEAKGILELLQNNGGNRSGIAIGAVDSHGNVFPDQFTRNHILGNLRENSFREIWSDDRQGLLAGLRDRKPLLKGRCSTCRWLDMCNGNFRARAEAVTGDFWESDPACYLTEAEIR